MLGLPYLGRLHAHLEFRSSTIPLQGTGQPIMYDSPFTLWLAMLLQSAILVSVIVCCVVLWKRTRLKGFLGIAVAFTLSHATTAIAGALAAVFKTSSALATSTYVYSVLVSITFLLSFMSLLRGFSRANTRNTSAIGDTR